MFSSPAPTSKRTRAARQPQQSSLRSRRSTSNAFSSPSPSVGSTFAEEPRIASQRREFADDRNSVVFCSRPEFSVVSLSGLPLELRQILRLSDHPDADISACRGTLDAFTTFSAICLPDSAFVLDYSTSSGLTQCYIFPNPTSLQYPNSTPFAAFLPRARRHEPGLMLCSIDGNIRVWMNVSLGLTGGEIYETTRLPLAPQEVVTTLRQIEGAFSLIGTSWGRMFRISIASAGGSAHIFAAPVTDSKGLLSRVASSILSSIAVPPVRDAIESIVVGPHPSVSTHGSDVWVLSTRQIQMWRLSFDTWDELIFAQGIDEILTAAGSSLECHPSRPILHDLITSSTNEFVVMVSYEDPQSPQTATHCLRLLKLSRDGIKSVQVVSTYLLPYRPTTSERGKLSAIGSDLEMILVHFGGCLLVQSLAQVDAFQSTLLLKSDSNRVLSVSQAGSANGVLDVLTFKNGLLRFRANLSTMNFWTSETPIHRIRSTLEQQIFFGTNHENPFLFQLDSQIESTVGLAAEQLSADILLSRSHLVDTSSDLRIGLVDRRTRLSSLIQYLNESHALHQISQLSRQRLWLDANRLSVAEALWGLHNQGIVRGKEDVLIRAIHLAMQHDSTASGEDSARVFFRSHLHRVNDLFKHLQSIAASTPPDGSSAPGLMLMNCSSIILKIWQVSETHRQDTLNLYGVDAAKALVSIWRHEHLQACQFFFDEIVGFLITFPSADVSKLLGMQLEDLASMDFSMWEARYDYLKSDDAQRTEELDACREGFSMARSAILTALIQLNHATAARELAERYHEYSVLVQLVTNIGPPHQHHHEVHELLEKFGEPFARCIYKWYLENGYIRELVEPNPKYRRLLDAFFKSENLFRIQWIYDLAKGAAHFHSARMSLEMESVRELRLGAKHAMLSLAKLSTMAGQLHYAGMELESKLQPLNAQLDTIGIQETLRQTFQEVCGRQITGSIDAACEAIAAACMNPFLYRVEAFAMLFKQATKRLIVGFSLNPAELVEVLSMKDAGNRSDDLITSLLIIPPSEHDNCKALLTAWRRIYLADDWPNLSNTAGISDEEVDQRLRTTTMYACLSGLKDAGRDDVHLAPYDAVGIISIQDVAADHPELTALEVSDLHAGYAHEQTLLQSYIGDYNLHEWYKRVLNLLSTTASFGM